VRREEDRRASNSPRSGSSRISKDAVNRVEVGPTRCNSRTA
jgi:hypothetical protein